MPVNKATRNQWMLKKYHEKRAEYLAGRVCALCGSTDKLHFHHREKENKKFTIGRAWWSSPEVMRAELEKCDVLCQECHKKAHAAAHGSLGRYRHQRCRCDLCREAHNKHSREYKKEWRKRRRVAQLDKSGGL